MTPVVLCPSATQAQDYSHDCDQQEHEDQATGNRQKGSAHQPFGSNTINKYKWHSGNA